LGVLLAARDRIVSESEFTPNGHALVWLVPWDGEKSSAIPLNACDPYFIEVCRRLRFVLEDDQLVCWRNNTSGTRIDAPDDLNGRTGDPWTPVNIGDAKALTLGGDGYTYELLQQLWFSDDYQRPPALEFHADDPEQVYLVATTLVRGQGKTQGFHERIIPVPKDASRLLGGDVSARKKLAKRAKRRVQLAAEVQSKVLRGPTFTLVYGGRSPSDPDWDKINAWIEAFDRRVDARFFDELWQSVQLGHSADEAEVHWHQVLCKLAEQQYREIRDSIPLPSIHRYRVLSQADGQFYGRLRSVLHRAFDDDDSNARQEEETDEQPALT
jgi:CRISPR system Cascade subunit CasA